MMKIITAKGSVLVNRIRSCFEVALSPAILLLFICLITYLPTIFNQFKIDDLAYLNKTFILKYSAIVDLFHYSENQHFNPINILLNNVLFGLIGNHVVPFHILNIFLFYLNCFLLYKICFLLAKDYRASLLTAVLFCLHPLNAEIVNQVVFNAVLLAAVFLQGGLICYDNYLTSGRKRDFVMSFLFSGLACLTLETSWIFPFYFIMWIWLVRRINVRHVLLSLILLCGIVFVLFVAWCFLSQGNSLSGGFIKKYAYFNMSVLTFLGSLIFLLFWYWQKLFIPIDGIWIYATQPLNRFHSLECISLLAILCAFIFLFRRKFFASSSHIFAGIWFISGSVFLLPGSLVHADVGLIIEPYWFYVSSMGFFIIVGMHLSRLGKHLSKIFYGGLLVLICGYLFLYTQRINIVAKTEKSYSEYWLRISTNPVPLTAVALSAFNNKEYEKSIAYYEFYLKKFSFSPYAVYAPQDIYITLANIYSTMGNADKAKLLIARALAIEPNNFGAHIVKANINVRDQNYAQAEKDFLVALGLNPKNLLAKVNLADLYLITKQEAKALALFKELVSAGLKGVDRANVYAKLAVLQFLYEGNNQSSSTIEKFLEKDSSPAAFIILGQAFESFNIHQIAISIFDEGLKLYPRNKELYLLSGIAWGHYGQLEKAIEIWERGLAIFPNDGDFINNLIRAKKFMPAQKN